MRALNNLAKKVPKITLTHVRGHSDVTRNIKVDKIAGETAKQKGRVIEKTTHAISCKEYLKKLLKKRRKNKVFEAATPKDLWTLQTTGGFKRPTCGQWEDLPRSIAIERTQMCLNQAPKRYITKEYKCKFCNQDTSTAHLLQECEITAPHFADVNWEDGEVRHKLIVNGTMQQRLKKIEQNPSRNGQNPTEITHKVEHQNETPNSTTNNQNLPGM